MFILRKRRIALMLFFLCFSFSIYFANSNSSQNRTYDVTQVSSIPVTEKVIVLDAGHRTEKTGGAVRISRTL